MMKVYIVLVDHASPYEEREHWQIHSVHKTAEGAEAAGRERASVPTGGVIDTPLLIDPGYKVVPMPCEE